VVVWKALDEEAAEIAAEGGAIDGGEEAKRVEVVC
jgi:hypothetical protein